MKVVTLGVEPLLTELAQLIEVEQDQVVKLTADEDTLILKAGTHKLLREACADADLGIECANETHWLAVNNFESQLAASKSFLTSSLVASVGRTAHRARHPERVVGWSILPSSAGLQQGDVVEVARGLATEDWALDAAIEFWQSLGLEPVEVADGPGLVRARVLCSLINEAASALADGVASAEDIDAAMQLGNNYPKGLLAWADELGLDLVLAVLEGIHSETGDPAYRPHPTLKRKVWAGHLGKMSGRGFYEYEVDA